MSHERAALRSSYFRELADRSRERLRAALGAADRCIHDEAIHRHAMKAVFLLEDTVFALEQIAQVYKEASRDRGVPSCKAYPANDAA